VHVAFTVANTGSRAGAEVAEIYTALPAGAKEPPKRLLGWSKVTLQPGETKQVEIEIDPLFLSIYNPEKKGWERVAGDYGFMVGGSSQDLPLKQSVQLQ
jgi:beta-glucosidase